MHVRNIVVCELRGNWSFQSLDWAPCWLVKLNMRRKREERGVGVGVGACVLMAFSIVDVF